MEYEKEENEMRRGGFLKTLAAILLGAAAVGLLAFVILQGISLYQSYEKKGNIGRESIDEMEYSSDDSKNTEVVLEEATTIPQTTVTDVSDVVESVMPAIVAIRCETETVSVTYDFFGRGRETKRKGSSAGTGIILAQNDTELLIVTNNHVIQDAVAIEVDFCDGSSATAVVKGTEENNDLAAIAVSFADIPEKSLRKIRLASVGNSDNVKMGEMVIAIGNALGYGQSTTVGYVSALNREVKVDNVSLNLLQVDAAINPGNSGGALLNANGEVIGINSVKYSATQVEGVGYAIPISEAIPIINSLMNREELKESEMAYLGIKGKNIDEDLAASFNKPVGIYVSEIEEGSPAELAGLHLGDIIVGIDKRKLTTMEDLQKVLRYTRANTTVTLQIKVLSEGQYIDKDLTVTLGCRPEK